MRSKKKKKSPKAKIMEHSLIVTGSVLLFTVFFFFFLVSENSMYDIISAQKTKQTIQVFVRKIFEDIIIEIWKYKKWWFVNWSKKSTNSKCFQNFYNSRPFSIDNNLYIIKRFSAVDMQVTWNHKWIIECIFTFYLREPINSFKISITSVITTYPFLLADKLLIPRRLLVFYTHEQITFDRNHKRMTNTELIRNIQWKTKQNKHTFQYPRPLMNVLLCSFVLLFYHRTCANYIPYYTYIEQRQYGRHTKEWFLKNEKNHNTLLHKWI